MPTDWGSTVKEALENLNADDVCVPGAKLRIEVARLAGAADRELATHLTNENLSFKQLLDTLDGVEVHVRLGTDMLVGLEGASLPESRGPYRTFVRPDVYLAFTRISPKPFHYVVGRDKFTQETAEGEKVVPVDPVTLELLIERRRSFAKELNDDEARDELLESLRGFANPLAAFQRCLSRLRLGGQWHNFNYERIKEDIDKWATKNELETSSAWFTDSVVADGQDAPQKILAEVARHMTDIEIRDLRIPFSAIEKLFKETGRRG